MTEPYATDVLSGMVKSLMKVRLLEHSSGLTVGMIVGSGDDSIITTGCVGLIRNVGSISGTGAVGGMNGVGVGAGEQDKIRDR
jgi:hypothetical protein